MKNTNSTVSFIARERNQIFISLRSLFIASFFCVYDTRKPNQKQQLFDILS